MPSINAMLLLVGTAFAMSLGVGELVRRLCLRWGILDRPNGERWHRGTPIPRLGGVAMFAALAVSVAVFVRHPLPRPVYGLLVGAAFAFAWGLVDDLRRLRTGVKLLLIIATGLIPLVFGISFDAPWPPAGMLLTALWVLGVTNAVNWFDNMDGMAAGVTAIAAAALFALSIISGHAVSAGIALALVGTALGFLALNLPPAKMFMGDCGSGMLGYSLAVTAVLATAQAASPFPRPILTAALVLGVPLLDMVMVAVLRVLHGRSIFAGGNDHLAHRLVALGLSERAVAVLFYAVGITTGIMAVLAAHTPTMAGGIAIGGGAALVASIGVLGMRVDVYRRPSLLQTYLSGERARFGASLLQGGLIAAWLSLLYSTVLADLYHQWRVDFEYSHGPLIPIVSAYLIWRQRDSLRRCPSTPSALGYPLILLGLALLVLGEAAVLGYLMRVSLLVVLVGLILFFSGAQMLKMLAFPLAYLLFMIPLPYIVFDRITLPLQFIASGLATSALDMMGISVLREGNIIILATTRLGVTEACSGIRSLIALGAIGMIYAYLAFPEWWRRVFIVASTVPIAIVTNAARVTVTAVLADLIGPAAAMGFYHVFSGWLIFVLALVLIVLEGAALSALVQSVSWRGAHAQGV